MPTTVGLGARTYVGVPVVGNDGKLVGTLCGLDPGTHPLDRDKAQVVSVLARLLAFQLERDALLRRETRNREALEALAAELRERMAREEELLGIVSHDLKSPLSAILLGGSLLTSRDRLDPRAHRTAERIVASATRATKLVHGLLDLAQTRRATMPIVPAAADLAEVVARALDDVRAAHPDRTIVVEASGPLVGRWDADRIVQLVINLVENALAYGAPGSPVTVRLAGTAADAVELAVHNEGAPIPEDVLPTIFEPLRRGTTGGRRGSVGLGLFIVKKIVEAHAGSIAVRSNAGAGTTFTVSLPRLPPGQRPTAPAGGDETGAATTSPPV